MRVGLTRRSIQYDLHSYFYLTNYAYNVQRPRYYLATCTMRLRQYSPPCKLWIFTDPLKTKQFVTSQPLLGSNYMHIRYIQFAKRSHRFSKQLSDQCRMSTSTANGASEFSSSFPYDYSPSENLRKTKLISLVD